MNKQRIKAASPTSRSNPYQLQEGKHSESFKHLRLQNVQLNRKLELKVNRIKELKGALSSLSKENSETNNAPTPVHHLKELKQSSVEEMLEAQAVTKDALEGYRRLERQFSEYRRQAASKIERLESQVTAFQEETSGWQHNARLNQQHQRSLERIQILDWKSKCDELQDELRESQRKQKTLEIQLEQNHAEMAKLKDENAKHSAEILMLKTTARQKEAEYRANLEEITHRLERISPAAVQPEALTELELLRERYTALLEKYTRRKLRTRQRNRQWREVMEQLLLRCQQASRAEGNPA